LSETKEFLVRTFIAATCAATNSQACRPHRTDRPYPYPRTLRRTAVNVLKTERPRLVCARGASAFFSASADASALLEKMVTTETSPSARVPPDLVAAPDRPAMAVTGAAAAVVMVVVVVAVVVVSWRPSPASHAKTSTRLRRRLPRWC
jgi:hypothetical protein